MIDGGGKWIKVELVQSGSRLQVTTLQRHQKTKGHVTFFQ